MSDYVSRDDGKIAVWQILEGMGYSSKHNDGLVEEVDAVFDDVPAADVRPVITCGECKHWVENGTDYCSCDRDALLRERDFFCAAGEKREER